MKKALLLLCLVAELISCTKETFDVNKEDAVGIPMTFNFSVADTKAAKTDWANTDKIYVFFNGLATKYLILEYDGSSWSNTSGGGTLLSTDFDGLGVTTLTAIHFPIAVDVAYADSKFSFTSGGKPVYNYYLYETGKAYTLDGTTVTASLAMGKPAGFTQIHIAGIEASVEDYTFGCSLIRPVACKSVGTDGTITESVLQAGARLSGVADADGGIFAGRLTSPDVAANYIFTLASDDNIYTLTRDSKTLTAGKMYNFPALSETGGANWAVTAASDLYVDLGLSVKWAKYNVGAALESDYGNFYAWGELLSKGAYEWSTYCYGMSATSITKYCNNSSYGKNGYTDALTILEKCDDVSYATLGGKFRMPTEAEWSELISNCTWITTTLNGNNVRQATSTKAGYTDKFIYLPTNPSDVGYAYYWTSSLGTAPDDGIIAYVYSYKKAYMIGRGSRYEGCVIRPVSD